MTTIGFGNPPPGFAPGGVELERDRAKGVAGEEGFRPVRPASCRTLYMEAAMSEDPGKPAAQTGPAAWERILVTVPPICLVLMAVLFPPAAPLLILAIVWIVLVTLFLALRRLILHGDRSALTNRHEPSADHTRVDLCTRTGLYQWLRDWDEQLLQDDNHPD